MAEFTCRINGTKVAIAYSVKEPTAIAYDEEFAEVVIESCSPASFLETHFQQIEDNCYKHLKRN